MSSIKNRAFQSWAVCLTSALFFFYIFVQMTMFNAINPSLLETFSVSGAELGKLSSAFFYSEILFLFPAGLILDRYSPRKIMLSMLALSIISMLLFSMTHSFNLALFYRFLMGVGGAFALLSCLRLATHWFPPHRLALVSGCIITIGFLGGMVSQTPLTILVDHYGWRDALGVVVGLGILFLGLIFLIVRDHPKGEKIVCSSEHVMTIQSLWLSIKQSVANKQNWLYGLYISLLNLPIFLLGAIWGDLYLEQIEHFTKAQASYVTSMLFLGAIIGSPIIGWISDRMGLRRIPMIIFAFLSFGIAVIMVCYSQFTMFESLVLFFALGFLTSAQVIGYPAITESNTFEVTGGALGLASILIMVGGAVSQPLFGFLVDSNWDGKVINGVPIYSLANYRSALLILPVAFILALIVIYFAKETYCRHKVQ